MALELTSVGQVIAERRFILDAGRDSRSEVILRLGIPQPHPDGTGYYCPLQFVGLGSERVVYAVGIDAVQALQLALTRAGIEIHFDRRGYGNRLYFLEHGDDLGFPDEGWTEGLGHQIVRAFGPVYQLRLSISRNAGSMKNFQFGAIRPHPNGKGTVGQFALHIHCPWRIIGADGLLTGSADWWEPAETTDSFDWDARNRDRNAPSLQAVMLQRLFQEYDSETKSYINTSDQLVVQQVEADDHGGLKMYLTGGYRLELFADGTRGEAWRLFEPARDTSHFIIEGGRFGHRDVRVAPLRAKTFSFIPFQYTVAPDDAYCEVCWATFSESGPGLREGYCATVPIDPADLSKLLAQKRWQRIAVHPVLRLGLDVCWVCSRCFEEFRDDFQLTVGPARTLAELLETLGVT